LSRFAEARTYGSEPESRLDFLEAL